MRSTACYLLLLLFPITTIAQIWPAERCAHDHALQELIKEQPNVEREHAGWIKTINDLKATSVSRSGNILRIPVVVHVIHSNEPQGIGSNVSMELVESQIQALNEDYRRLNDDASQTPNGFAGVAGDARIEFCLASVDPFGQPTSGVTRSAFPNIPSINYIENTIKPATSWDSRRFLNVWTVDLPSSTVIGYAFLPLASILGTTQDGVVINYRNFGVVNSSNRGRTTTHEIGHYLGLKHIWGDNNNSGQPIGCNSDDGVSDTPNQVEPYYFCPGGQRFSCGSSDMFMNYMDYTDDYCMNIFTDGQIDLMRTTLETLRTGVLEQGRLNCESQQSCLNLGNANFLMGFESNENDDEWWIEDANNDNNSWVFLRETNGDWGPNAGSGFAAYQWNPDAVTGGNDYLFTPCFEVEGGHTYRVEFSIACAASNNTVFPERLRVGLSASQSSTDFITPGGWTFDPVQNAYPDYESQVLTFDVRNSGSLSIGFYVFSSADQYVLQLDDIRISDEGLVSSTEELGETESMQLFPNPVVDQLTVSLSLTQVYDGASVEVYDVLGQLVDAQAVAPSQEQDLFFDFTAKNPGIYFVTLRAADKVHTQKVLYSGPSR
ncbi:MAG: M43 family zinc metalloprotease [Bacteroidota bacterium]